MVDTLIYSKKSKFYGMACTVAIVGALFLFLWLFIIRTPNPPYPDAGGGAGNGIEVSLGFSDVKEEMPVETAPAEAASSSTEEDIATQDVEDAPVIAQKLNKKTTQKKTVVKQDQPAKVTQPTVNKKALFPSQSNTGQASAGSPNGSIGAKAFGGQGGSGGIGGGSGGGIGTGIGMGSGKGISYNLSGRVPQSLPTPEYKQQVEGVVVVAVTVDKDGRVTQADPGVKGSTTLDEGLLMAAKKAALQARFDRKPDAPAFQKGTISYKFRLQ
jgi:TonB family protein